MSLSDLFNVFDRYFGADTHRKRQRIKLLGSLIDDKSKGASGVRSLEALTLKSGMTPEECRSLLSEMGCEGVKMNDGREGWRRIND